MSFNTDRLNLFEYDPVADANSTYNITNALNDNFDKIDANTLQIDQITNCFLEMPQRIKYALADNLLTIKEGSVLIFPYGTSDLSSSISVGDTFLNSNYKVVDTQFIESEESGEPDRFFVWAEIQEDTSNSLSWSYATSGLMCACPDGTVRAADTNRFYSGASAPSTNLYVIWYDTTNNVIKQYSSGSLVSSNLSFPFLQCEINGNNTVSDITKVTEVFNGLGFIGNVVYCDKGIKGLAANGRNSKGLLENTPYTTDKLSLYVNTVARNCSHVLLNISSKKLHPYNENFNYNEILNVYDDGTAQNVCLADGWVSEKDSPYRILGLSPRKTVNIAMNQDIDGEYIRKYATLATGVTWREDNQTYIYDLSDYLPKDNNKYLVSVRAFGRTGTTSGDKANIYAKTDFMSNDYSYGLGSAITRNSNYVHVGNVNVDVIVGERRTIQIIVTAGDCTNAGLAAVGYRKIR